MTEEDAQMQSRGINGTVCGEEDQRIVGRQKMSFHSTSRNKR